MAESPTPEQPEHDPPPSAPEPDAAPGEEEAPVATDFRRNLWLLLIVLGVVVLAWVLAVVWRRVPEQIGELRPPQAPPSPPPPPAKRSLRATPVEISRVIGPETMVVAAAPAIVLPRGNTTYRLARLFDVTNMAEGFSPGELLRFPNRWADQMPTLRLRGDGGPRFQPAAQIERVGPEDRVVVLETPDGPRAYPVAQLRTCTGVQDEVGGRAVFVFWNSMTQMARCLLAEVDGRALSWADAGWIYRGNAVLYENETGSLWDSFSGLALTGAMAGRSAAIRPVSVWPWGLWLAEHPEAAVLTSTPGALGPPPKKAGHAQSRLDAFLSTPDLPFKPAHFDPSDDTLPAKAYVLGVRIGDEARAYPLEALTDAGIGLVGEVVGGKPIEVRVTSPRTAYATSDGELVDATVALWFAWKEQYPASSLYEPRPDAAP